MLSAYTPDPEPEPANGGGFVSVFDSKQKRADRYFNNFEYKSAIKLYNKLIAKGKANDGVKLRLAVSYLKINDPVNAEKWYAEVIHTDQVTPEHQIQYAHTLLSNGKYQEAREVINSYEFADSDYRSKAIINTLDKLEVFYADSMFYDLKIVEDNKPQYSDFSPTIYKEGIVFVSSRNNKGPKFKWDDSPFLDLYYTESDVASAKPFSATLNSKYHEGPITFYDNYSKAIFTRSNYLEKQLGTTDQGINNLQLYTASWNAEKNDWDQIKPIDFTINNYSYGHPSISFDETKLYFVSDMPGGFGATDIYVSEKTAEGWSEPINMGEIINTSANEMYPFIDDQQNLYFASNGHGGLGGLDMYQVQLEGSMDLRNMGYPLNTTADDFGFSLTPSGKIAYISSNRDGADNIFQIDIKAPDLEMILADNSVNGPSPSEIDQKVSPLATNELSTFTEETVEGIDELSTIDASIVDENNELLKNADLKLLVDGEETRKIRSDENGEVSIQVPADKEYTLIAEKEGFEDRVITIPAETLGQQEDVLIVMNSADDDELPTNELEPLAVTDDGLQQSKADGGTPIISGVALAALPGSKDNEAEETTELEPLSVNADNWDESTLGNSDRPDIEGVALTSLPETTGNDQEISGSEARQGEPNESLADWPGTADDEGEETTELAPLAVNADNWDESNLGNSDRPDIEGVALTSLPETTGNDQENSGSETMIENVDNYTDRQEQNESLAAWSETPDNENEYEKTNELAPLAVNADNWDESNLGNSDRPDIEGVALTSLPETTVNDQENSGSEAMIENVDNYTDRQDQPNESLAADIPGPTGEEYEKTNELEPLAVNADNWDESNLSNSERPDIEGVALTSLPETTGNDRENSGSEAMIENVYNYTDRQDQPNESLAADIPAPKGEEYEKTNELEPLAVNADNWDESNLGNSDRPDIEGVALTSIPKTTDDAVRENTELAPLSVNAENLDEGNLDNNNRPDIEGVALTSLPKTTDDAVRENTELAPLSVNAENLDEGDLDNNNRPDIEGVALTSIPETTDDAVREATELAPLSVNAENLEEGNLDNSNRPDIEGVALTSIPKTTDDAVRETTELTPLSVNAENLDEGDFDNNNRPDIEGVALTSIPETTGNSQEISGSEATTDYVDNYSEGQDEPNELVAAGSDTADDEGEETAELAPLAVNVNNPNQDNLNNTDRLNIPGVALSALPGSKDEEHTETTELEPLAVNANNWDESNNKDNNRLALESNKITSQGQADAAGKPVIQSSFNQDDPLAMNTEPGTEDFYQENETSDSGLPFSSNETFDSNEKAFSEPNAIHGTDEIQKPVDSNILPGVSTELATVANNQNQQNVYSQIEAKEAIVTNGAPRDPEKQLVVARVIDENSSDLLKDADIKLFVDNPNETLDYEIKNGQLTFEPLADEEYMIVVSHEEYQDEYIKLSGNELLANKSVNDIPIGLVSNDLKLKGKNKKGPVTKFKTLVTDEETNELLEDAQVKFFVDGKAIESEFTEDNGKTVFKSPKGDDYMVMVSRTGYQDLIYNLPGAPETDMDVDLAMLKAEELPASPRLMAVKEHAFDTYSGVGLDEIEYQIFENGDLIETTNDLTSIEIDPENEYQILASKSGYDQSLTTITPGQAAAGEPLDLQIPMQQQQISEVTGAPVYQQPEGELIPTTATITDITNDQPISDAVVQVFADNQVQEQTTTWKNGLINLNVIPGKEYRLMVTREGYSDRIINLGVVEDAADKTYAFNMIPDGIQSLRQSGVDLEQAKMLVMPGPSGDEQMYLSTDKDLYQLTVENGNHYLVKDDQKIILEERKRSISSKVVDKQDSDQFNLRLEDQFLYDQLSADEKEMVNRIVAHRSGGSSLEDNPELEIYYNNLPEEYRGIIDNMIVENSNNFEQRDEINMASNNSLEQALRDNKISVYETFNINNIYYDFDKSDIREDAAVELDKLILIMKANKNIRVDMFSHTDSRGSNSYNDMLSNRRGIAAVDYMVERGIDLERFNTQAHGELLPVNSCNDSVECSEQAHQLNRRTEFRLSA